MKENRTPVTVIGLGLMGQALAAAFLQADHPTTIWNRTPAKAQQLITNGAKLADSPKAAIAASPLVVICLTDYDAVHNVLNDLDLNNRTLVNLTSGTSQEARDTADWAAHRGATYLDGAIMAIPQAIGTPESLILYRGPRSSFDQNEPTLQSLGPGMMYLSADHGLSSLYDAAGLSLMWSVLNGFLQGTALLSASGVDASTFATFAQQNIGTVADWLSGYAQQIDNGDYQAPDATIDTHRAAMDHLVHESEAQGINADLPRFFKALADRAIANGHGPNGYAAMIDLFRNQPSPG